MGIFVEEASAFIIGGLIAGAFLVVNYTREGKGDMYNALYLIFLCVCIILAVIGVADVALDHIGSDETQQTTP